MVGAKERIERGGVPDYQRFICTPSPDVDTRPRLTEIWKSRFHRKWEASSLVA